MRVSAFHKLNRAGVGYTHVWADGEALIDPVTLDRSLPPVADCTTRCVAYAVTRLQPDTLVLAIGVRWPQLGDEFGRRGLTVWHGLVCSGAGDADRTRIAGLLLGLLDRHRLPSPQDESLIARLATDRMGDADWLRLLTALSDTTELTVNRHDQQLIVQIACAQLPPRANLKPASEREQVVAVAAFALSAVGRAAAGGELIGSRARDRFGLISTEASVPGYSDIGIEQLSKLVTVPEPVPRPNPPPPVPAWRMWASVGGGAVVVILVVVWFFVIRPSGPDIRIDPSPPVEVSLPENVVEFTATASDSELTVVCSPPSGTAFKVGESKVTCVATDQAGVEKASREFWVIVSGAAQESSTDASQTSTTNESAPPSQEPSQEPQGSPVQ